MQECRYKDCGCCCCCCYSCYPHIGTMQAPRLSRVDTLGSGEWSIKRPEIRDLSGVNQYSAGNSLRSSNGNMSMPCTCWHSRADGRVERSFSESRQTSYSPQPGAEYGLCNPRILKEIRIESPRLQSRRTSLSPDKKSKSPRRIYRFKERKDKTSLDRITTDETTSPSCNCKKEIFISTPGKHSSCRDSRSNSRGKSPEKIVRFISCKSVETDRTNKKNLNSPGRSPCRAPIERQRAQPIGRCRCKSNSFGSFDSIESGFTEINKTKEKKKETKTNDSISCEPKRVGNFCTSIHLHYSPSRKTPRHFENSSQMSPVPRTRFMPVRSREDLTSTDYGEVFEPKPNKSYPKFSDCECDKTPSSIAVSVKHHRKSSLSPFMRNGPKTTKELNNSLERSVSSREPNDSCQISHFCRQNYYSIFSENGETCKRFYETVSITKNGKNLIQMNAKSNERCGNSFHKQQKRQQRQIKASETDFDVFDNTSNNKEGDIENEKNDEQLDDSIDEESTEDDYSSDSSESRTEGSIKHLEKQVDIKMRNMDKMFNCLDCFKEDNWGNINLTQN